MGVTIELLVSKSEKIIESLPTDKKLSDKINKYYQQVEKELIKKYKYFSPTYHKNKPEPIYIC